MPLMEGKSAPERLAFSEYRENEGDLSINKWEYTKVCLRSPAWKLIYTYVPSRESSYELYNLKADPLESQNLIEIEKKQFKKLRAELMKWIRRPKIETTPLVKALESETKRRLRSLGYLQ